MKDIVRELKNILGQSILTEDVDLVPYEYDASPFNGKKPIAVVLPSSVDEVSRIMKICNEYNTNVVVRGGGTSLTGSSIPDENSIVISTIKLNKIIEINTVDRYAYVETGVKLDDLNYELSKFNFIYPPDPGSSIAATVGGSISTNAGGMRGAMYGATKEWVLGLEVVLADGSIIQTGGKVLKRSTGYDLTALLLGSEGTLGVVTKAYLKITPKPESTCLFLCYYDDIKRAASAIGEMNKNGIIPLMAEFMDRIALLSLKKTKNLDFPENANYLVLIDVATTKESLERYMNITKSIIKETSPVCLFTIVDEEKKKELYNLRKGLYSSELAERERSEEKIIIGDVVVPPSKLPESLESIRTEIDQTGFKGSLFGHIGDGNIHVNLYYNSSDEKERERAFDLLMRIAKISISLGGSVSAEHGLGLEKKDLLMEEMRFKKSMKNIELMKKIKNIFDERNIMNRGKMF